MTLAFLVVYALLTLYGVVTVFLGVGYHPALTPISSLTAFTFSVLHGRQRLGWPRLLLLLACTILVSLAFESIGVASGVIYGPYHYTDKLGMKFLDLVPLIIPVAWFMMSYPAFIIARRVMPSMRNTWGWRVGLAAIGALVMTAWDLSMDPMMVNSNHWVWEQEGAYFGIPLQNYFGWWLTIFVAFLSFMVVARITPGDLAQDDHRFERWAVISYALTGLSSVIVDFQVGLGGPAMVGLFAQLPWVVIGWISSESTQL